MGRGGLRKTETAKSSISDAEKRAAVKWGLGRYLYQIGEVEVDVGTPDGKGRASPQYTETGRLAEKDGGNYFKWKLPLVPRHLWPSDYVPAGMDQRIKVAKGHLVQAIAGKKFEEAERLLAFAHGSPEFGEKHLSELRTYTVEQINLRLPDGQLPAMADHLHDRRLLTDADFKVVMDRIDYLLAEEVKTK